MVRLVVAGAGNIGLVMQRAFVGGRYVVERLLGSGGMAQVYLTHDAVLDRRVALKILRDQYAEDEESAQTDLAAVGLNVGRQDETPSDTLPIGVVSEQNPVEGAEVEEGTAVDIVVSTGPSQAPVNDEKERERQRQEEEKQRERQQQEQEKQKEKKQQEEEKRKERGE